LTQVSHHTKDGGGCGGGGNRKATTIQFPVPLPLHVAQSTWS